ncbi:hypothetical protein J7T55_005178 [Diaporthe amygdali]|uniref:uncharacterized protein n=1 Tax=Phomopsis amygdali TaxID=1214568 RepID=UPI0022FEF830|nr:uncharacterized protein J7T55_005178 [Diaporthe amygdali]KAJ0116232.1 hypothetical protein J7T55_005178 [Diaporthe amygdali]
MKFTALLNALAALSFGVSAATTNAHDDSVACVGACGHDYSCVANCFNDKRDLEQRQSDAQECVFGCAKDDYGCYSNCFN